MGPLRACSLLAFSSLILIEAHAATTQTSTASASFVYMSDDGCVQNQVIVFANRMTPISSQAPGTAIEVTYFRDRYDYCKESDLGTDTGTSRRPLFSADLNRAALNATIDGHTVTGSPVTISFDLVWEGQGTITGRKAALRAHGESGRLMHRQTLSRNAAVNGSVDDHDISGAVVGASLQTISRIVSR